MFSNYSELTMEKQQLREVVGVLHPHFLNGSSCQKLVFIWSESFLIVWYMNALLCYTGMEILTSVKTMLP